MGRRVALTPDQVEAIRASTKTLAELKVEYGVSTLTLGKVRRFQGAYKNSVLEFGTPVLDSHGIITNVIPAEGEGDEELPFVPNVRFA